MAILCDVSHLIYVMNVMRGGDARYFAGMSALCCAIGLKIDNKKGDIAAALVTE
jgi:Flp pilus assembly protein protease CpaA